MDDGYQYCNKSFALPKQNFCNNIAKPLPFLGHLIVQSPQLALGNWRLKQSEITFYGDTAKFAGANGCGTVELGFWQQKGVSSQGYCVGPNTSVTRISAEE
jgi:hypothetical protein